MSKNLISLHVMVNKKDVDVMNALSPNHGDLSIMVRHLIKSFCDELRAGKMIVLPPEILAQIEDLKKEKQSEEHEDINEEIS